MGKCKHCGEKAGFLRWSHPECVVAHREAERKAREMRKASEPKFKQFIQETIAAREVADLDGLINGVAAASKEAADGHFPVEEQCTWAAEAMNEALDDHLDDGALSEEEETGVFAVMKGLPFGDDHDGRDAFNSRLYRAHVLRRILNGEDVKDVANFKLAGHMPFNLMKSETLIWAKYGVDFQEERTSTHYEGGSQGFSVRVTKGVYYRFGGFKGHKVQEHNMEYIDTGLFGLTNKHLYFHGERKTFRTRLDRIVALDPYQDGIGVRKQGVTARPQIFVGIDGWFAFNLIKHFGSGEE